jgi:phage baseplate assembly protein W
MSQKFIGVTLPIQLGNNGMFNQSTNVLIQTRSNFKNLILTKKGERLAQPELGCDLWNVLFDQFTEDTYDRARLAVVDAIDKWLPFLELTQFELSHDDATNSLQINCNYRFRNNPNVTDTVTLNILTTALTA